ncbi:MAG: ATP-binding protein [Oscillospiraceae bacterium]|nr:ATP-binding protein [Oscillospiraceae bacterium]
MKNIIIVGASRSGKTTLAKRLNEELGCFVISLDKLVAAFAGAYPQLDIRLAWNREKTTENLAPFIGHFLGMFSSDSGRANELYLQAHAVTGNKFVIEGAYFDFSKISSILKTYGIEEIKDRFHLIGLAQNNKTPDEFFSDFRKYDTVNDWTYNFSDDELREYISQDVIPANRSMTDDLLKHGFTIYDTSTQRERVFDKIIADIKSEIQPSGVR